LKKKSLVICRRKILKASICSKDAYPINEIFLKILTNMSKALLCVCLTSVDARPKWYEKAKQLCLFVVDP
jgi:hypothetical protein